MSLFCNGHLLLGIKCGLYVHCDAIGKQIFLCKKTSIADSFFVKDGSSCSLSPLSAGAPSSLNLCKPYVCYHSFCEFICVSVPLCLEDMFPWCHPFLLALTSFLPPCLHSSLSPDGWGLMETSQLGPYPKIFHSLNRIQLWVFILVPLYCKKRLSDNCWARYWSMAIEKCL